jgi:hypothetical protein
MKCRELESAARTYTRVKAARGLELPCIQALVMYCCKVGGGSERGYAFRSRPRSQHKESPTRIGGAFLAVLWSG